MPPGPERRPDSSAQGLSTWRLCGLRCVPGRDAFFHHIEEAMTIKLGRTTVPPVAPSVARDRRLAVWVLMAVAVGLGFLVKLHS
jgi:hypothetical protein